MATRIAAKGTNFQLSIASVYTTIAAVERISAPDAEVQTFDGTALDGGVGMAFKPTGYVNGGTAGFSLFFDPVDATHQALTDLITTPAVAAWKVIWSDAAATVWPFSGVLTKFHPQAQANDKLMADVEIKLDGIPTYPT